MDLQLGLSGETFTSLETIYGRAAHQYGLKVRKVEEGKSFGDKRKDVGNHVNENQHNQGGFKKLKGL